MPCRKPASSKQREAELQLKLAIKRGGVPAPPIQPKPPRGKKAQRSLLAGCTGLKASEPPPKRLQSAFLKVEPEFLKKSRGLAATEDPPRPLLVGAAVLDKTEVGLHANEERLLTCPKRPKWQFDMEKEVEKNQEDLFHEWMIEIDGHVES